MLIYFTIIFILFVFSVHEVTSNNKKNKRLFLIFSFILLVLVVGLRWETGTDWLGYHNLFLESVNLKDLFVYNGTIESGYLIFNFIVRTFTDNYSWLLFLHACVFYFLLIYSLTKLTHYPQLSLLIIFSTTLGMMGSNRQLLALSICLFALTFLLKNKKFSFLGLIASSLFFHTSSLLFSIYYFFNRKINSKYLYVVILIAYLLGLSQIPLLIFNFLGGLNELTGFKTQVYLDSAQNALQTSELSIFGVLKRLFFFILFIFVRDNYFNKHNAYNVFLNGYVTGIIFYFLFSNTLLVMVSRGSLYFNIMETFLLTSIMYTMHNKTYKIVYLFGVVILSILSMYQSIALYPDLFDPYKGIFINSFFKRSMY